MVNDFAPSSYSSGLFVWRTKGLPCVSWWSGVVVWLGKGSGIVRRLCQIRSRVTGQRLIVVMIDHVFDRAHGICALQKWRVCRLQVGITWKSINVYLVKHGDVVCTVYGGLIWRCWTTNGNECERDSPYLIVLTCSKYWKFVNFDSWRSMTWRDVAWRDRREDEHPSSVEGHKSFFFLCHNSIASTNGSRQRSLAPRMEPNGRKKSGNSESNETEDVENERSGWNRLYINFEMDLLITCAFPPPFLMRERDYRDGGPRYTIREDGIWVPFSQCLLWVKRRMPSWANLSVSD